MSVALSSRFYKNTNCLGALLENAGLFVTASFYPSLSGNQVELYPNASRNPANKLFPVSTATGCFDFKSPSSTRSFGNSFKKGDG